MHSFLSWTAPGQRELPTLAFLQNRRLTEVEAPQAPLQEPHAAQFDQPLLEANEFALEAEFTYAALCFCSIFFLCLAVKRRL